MASVATPTAAAATATSTTGKKLLAKKAPLRRALPTYASTRTASVAAENVEASVDSILRQYGVRPPRNEVESYMDAQGGFVELTAAQEAEMLGRLRRGAALVDLHQEMARLAGGEPPALAAWAAAAGAASPAALTEELAAAAVAKRIVVASNIPLVMRIVKRDYAWRLRMQQLQLSAEDLKQEGICGLIRAAETFRLERNVRFRTYAWRGIKNHIDLAIQNGGRLVRVPKAAAARATHLPATTAGGAAARRAVAATRYMVSLDRPYPDGSTFGDALPSAGASADEEGAQLEADLRQLLSAALTPRERRLLGLRYGLDGGRPRTLKECAELMYLSTEHARRLSEASLQKLRAHIEGSGGGGDLAEYLAVIS